MIDAQNVYIESSVESRPIEIGGTNNAAVNGINLTSAELARITTLTTGTLAIGDSGQTGNIILNAVVPATAGPQFDVNQSTSGPGQIILGDGSSSMRASTETSVQ